MSADGRPTVLLGRPGEFRDRLESALREAGANITLVVDPSTGNAAQVKSVSPRNVVVLMEPGVEEALDARFDALFDDPAIELLFEEASVLASRQGWDLARWGRHLSAKLSGSQNVLPAGHGDDAGFVAPLPRDALKPKTESDMPAEPAPVVVDEQSARIEKIEQSVHAAAAPVVSKVVPALELEGLEDAPAPASPALELEGLGDAPAPASAPGLEGHDFAEQAKPVAAPRVPAVDFANDGLDYLEPVKRIPHGGGDHRVEAYDPVVFLDAAHHLPDASPIQLDPLEPLDHVEHPRDDVIEMDHVAAPVADVQPLALASAASMDAPDMAAAPLHETWSLVQDDKASVATPKQQHASAVPAAARLDGMSLVDDGTIGLEAAESGPMPTHEAAGTRGAVLIVAGVGGPDPLRALLGQLQDDFPRPILIQQHLDAGNYDRLARQMERATRLKVKLASAGMAMEDNTVYVLPNSLGLEDGAGGLSFVDMPQVRGFTDVTSKLDPGDSALLVLSGAPTDFIEEALRFKVAGAWVAVQAEHGCFDHAVPAIVAARGAEIAEPLALAQKINARWHA